MSTSRIYHIGIVVEDLDAAMAELTAATGVTWAEPQRDVTVTFATPEGPRTWPVTFVFSKEAPYLELLERMDDSLWPEAGFHHLGVWTGNVAAESTALEGNACTWQAAMTDESGVRAGGCYHLMPASSSRIELVSTERSRPRLERYLAGGEYM